MSENPEAVCWYQAFEDERCNASRFSSKDLSLDAGRFIAFDDGIVRKMLESMRVHIFSPASDLVFLQAIFPDGGIWRGSILAEIN